MPGITGLIDRLEQARYVRRERCENDRRVIYVVITQAALALLARLDKPVRDLQARLMRHMTAAELKSLSRLLEKVRDAMPDQRQPNQPT